MGTTTLKFTRDAEVGVLHRLERVWNSLDLTGGVGRGVSACEQPSLSGRLRVWRRLTRSTKQEDKGLW